MASFSKYYTLTLPPGRPAPVHASPGRLARISLPQISQFVKVVALSPGSCTTDLVPEVKQMHAVWAETPRFWRQRFFIF